MSLVPIIFFLAGRLGFLGSFDEALDSVFEFWVLRFRVLGASFSSLGCSVFEFWVLRFRDLGASYFGLRFRTTGRLCFRANFIFAAGLTLRGQLKLTCFRHID